MFITTAIVSPQRRRVVVVLAGPLTYSDMVCSPRPAIRRFPVYAAYVGVW